MRLGMSLGYSQTQTQTQTQTQRQTQRQRLAQRIKNSQMLSLRITLLQALYPNGRFHPSGRCPTCEYQMEVKEILAGFSDDPNDFDTTCPKCSRRFAPKMRAAESMAGHIELPFYCEIQTEGLLRDTEPIEFKRFEKEHSAILQSARFYFGTLTKAYEQVGIEYEGEPTLDWKERVVPFLGKCPDSLIADCVGKSKSSIQRLRKKHGVPAYSASNDQ